ncbi:iron ABC transporter [Gordonia spumicola]|uniref:Iron ABC transporter n=1 Tax=Gordonia spumicola TaxID=589161 RepID=A0A7I9VA61_9ACTN|nr:iron ABC transporter permease [Gordonia spumicola]GEE02227.1 iron ABC transporter [Gordonia spumicola]
MSTTCRAVVSGLTLAGLAVILFAVRLGVSDYPMSPVDVARILLGGGTRIENVVVFENQLPIGLVGLIVGFAFGMAGSLTQLVARNPLATPDLLGITSGASAAAVAWITVGPVWAAGISLPVAAVLGGLASAVAMYLLSWRGGIDPVRLVLVGVALTAGMQAIIAYLLTRAEIGQAHRAQLWIVGSVSGADWPAVWAPLAVLVPAAVVVAAQSRNLRVLGFSEDTARGLGVNVARSTGSLLLVAVVVSAVAVSSAGPIAFVALLAPLVATRLVRGGAPAPFVSGLTGACLVVAADIVCNTVLPAGVPVGVVTAGIGGPALIYLMVRLNRRASA